MRSRPSLTLAKCAGGCSSSASLKRDPQSQLFFCVNCLWKKNIGGAGAENAEPKSEIGGLEAAAAQEDVGTPRSNKRKLETKLEIQTQDSSGEMLRPTLRRSVSFADKEGQLLAEIMRGCTPNTPGPNTPGLGETPRELQVAAASPASTASPTTPRSLVIPHQDQSIFGSEIKDGHHGRLSTPTAGGSSTHRQLGPLHAKIAAE